VNRLVESKFAWSQLRCCSAMHPTLLAYASVGWSQTSSVARPCNLGWSEASFLLAYASLGESDGW
jgi:hypothetical protein